MAVRDRYELAELDRILSGHAAPNRPRDREAQRAQMKDRGVDLKAEDFRAGFWGKQPPVSFWWGSFDLAVTRYDLVGVPPAYGMDLISRVGGDSEQAAVGFWPGNDRYAKLAFFAYTYPKTEGLEGAVVSPDAVGWNPELGEFLLDYEDVRIAQDPRAAILAFANSTYEAGVSLAGWDRELLERRPAI